MFGFEQGADSEHGTSTFGVGCGDDGGVNPIESTIIEKFVDGLGGLVSDTHDRAESVAADAEVGDFTEEFEGCAFLLEGVGGGIGLSENGDAASFEFDRLTLSGALDKFTGKHDT